MEKGDKKVKILCLDIGVTTGFAILYGRPAYVVQEGRVFPAEAYPQVIKVGEFYLDKLEKGLKTLMKPSRGQVGFAVPPLKGLTQVFFEEPSLAHKGRLGDQLRKAVFICRNLFPGAVNVPPGKWKTPWIQNMVKGQNGMHLKQRSTHELDAVGIGFWAFVNPGLSGLKEEE
jgi:hypothetical protein